MEKYQARPCEIGEEFIVECESDGRAYHYWLTWSRFENICKISNQKQT